MADLGYAHYLCATTNEQVTLSDDELGFLLSGSDIHARKWAGSMGSRSMTAIACNAREATFKYVASDEHANRLRASFDADLRNGTPGTLVYQGWSMRCYVMSETTEVQYGNWVKRVATAAFLDGMWWRVKTLSLMPGTITGVGGKTYEYGYEYDYGRPTLGGVIDTGELVACKPLITVYGPVSDPYIIIAGNRYQVYATVASGSRVVIDGKSKTITHIAPDGTEADLFANALRGSGEGGGQYIFQPIPPGSQGVTWDDSFGIDIGWYEESSEPPWNRS